MLLPGELGQQRQQQLQFGSQLFAMRAALAKEVFMLYLSIDWAAGVRASGESSGEEWKGEEPVEGEDYAVNVRELATDAVGAADALLAALGVKIEVVAGPEAGSG